MSITQTLDPAALPDRIDDVAHLDRLLCTPSQALVDDLDAVEGDIMVLGVAGKMGPTVAGLAKAAAPGRRVIGVARFSEAGSREALEAIGVETIACDLLDEAAIAALPKSPNVIFMAGRKFGASGDQSLTWAMNTHVPALVAQAFSASRIVAFSTGCVYPFVDVTSGGATEETPINPPGEYAQSCVGRERMFEYFSRRLKTPGRLFRLNYAIDMRYGVLHDIAAKIVAGKPVDVTMGHVNVIWQGDAASQAIRLLRHATTPTTPINVSGPQTLAVRDLAMRLAQKLGREAIIEGTEAPNAWLVDTSAAQTLFGQPVVDIERMIQWTADWMARDMPSLGKPTKFEVRDGRY
ncbi:NAD-dependent epimerase/dehydratase family protein [Mangrovicella endophytica]|uniref:NAD-dependent epimerase/dehydratase family protein n=1 Tax=Mangrovicella endophytica TaxID=2066697 RepID=UPI000C9E07D7|nr:NAD(P)-dependent oxidoreductase [Mangrovicella endophytica]